MNKYQGLDFGMNSKSGYRGKLFIIIINSWHRLIVFSSCSLFVLVLVRDSSRVRWPVLKIKSSRRSCLIRKWSSQIDGVRYLLGSPMIFKILYYLGPGSLIAIAARNDSNTVSNWIETKVVLNKNCSEKMSPLVIHSHPQSECCRVVVFVPAHFSLRIRATVTLLYLEMNRGRK